MEGLVFNIQKFSIHDGPGIRTTVFLKGCPLRCRWCANPESNDVRAELLHTPSTCVKCETCVHICPKGALHFEEERLICDKDVCISCFACAGNCPTRALTIEGEWQTVEQVVAEVKKDEPFYERSGGGVTLSGGEPLMQEEFTLELLKALKEAGIHTNIETTGYTSKEYLDKVLPYLDMIYMDFKHPDSKKHEEKTGVPNEQIIENMAYIIGCGKDLTVRVPVIPRYNHSPEVAHAYGKKLKEIGATKLHLLPFHQMGSNKWKAMGLDYEYADEPAMKEEEVEEMADIIESYGISVQISG